MLQPTKTEVSLLQQARLLNFNTPFFYTSREVLEKNYHMFTNLFDNVGVFYALKANSEPQILTYLNSIGCGFEAASGYEIEILLKLGVDPQKIVYGTSIKPAAHIRMAYASGIRCFAADSREEIKKIADNAPGSRVFVRTIVDDAGSVFMMSERFGAPAAAVVDLMLYAKQLELKLYGLSFYVGSQAANAKMWAKGIRTLRPLIETLFVQGITLEVINIGGGFPVHYDNHRDAPELKEIVVSLHNALHELPYTPKILIEPGRGIVATSTVLITEVIARNDRAGKPWLCLDAGIYNALYEAMIHQGSTRYPVYPFNVPSEPGPELVFTLAGPTGDSLDVIARDVRLPAYTDVGDRLIFEHAGAYSVTMASRFNGFPPVPVYMG
jgi:ornithine decarboxylase